MDELMGMDAWMCHANAYQKELTAEETLNNQWTGCFIC